MRGGGVVSSRADVGIRPYSPALTWMRAVGRRRQMTEGLFSYPLPFFRIYGIILLSHFQRGDPYGQTVPPAT